MKADRLYGDACFVLAESTERDTNPFLFQGEPQVNLLPTAEPRDSSSGVARTSPLLGHSMGPLSLYELPREVQKLIWDLGASSPWKFRNFIASQVGSEAIYRSEV